MKALFFLVFLFCPLFTTAQNWPEKIRGYKLHEANVSITNADQSASDTSDVIIKLANPTFDSFGLSGAVIEIGATVTSIKQSGRVDFVTFQNIVVNGFKVDVEEYKHTFSFKKGEPTALPKPARINFKITSLARAAFDELIGSKEELNVTGTALVFGRFKKYGFNFKRVVPVRINLTLRNPLR